MLGSVGGLGFGGRSSSRPISINLNNGCLSEAVTIVSNADINVSYSLRRGNITKPRAKVCEFDRICD